MSQAPPTPPPTSTTELMDQEKDAAATAAPVAMSVAVALTPPAAAPTVAPVPAGAGGAGGLDHYHRLLPTLVDFIAQHNYLEVIRVAELADLKAEGDDRPSRLALTVPLVLAYLIQDEPAPARFALTRLPNPLAGLSITMTLFQLLATSWERQYARVYTCAELLRSMAREPAFPDPALAPVMDVMINEFVETFRRRAVALIGKAYSSLPLTAAQPYVGLPTEQTVALLTGARWSYDPASQILTPPSAVRQMPGRVIAGPSTLATFNFVAATAAEIEA